jgi:Leucine-rich repeat (LRR) protein
MHLYWIEKGFTKEDIRKTHNLVTDEDPFQNVTMKKMHQEMGALIKYKDSFLLSDFEKITFLHLNYSEYVLDLSFLKYCINLEEIKVPHQKLKSLEILANLVQMKKIDAKYNDIENIDCLYALRDLEEINLENNPVTSLQPIKHLNKLTKINIDKIEDENEVFQILKNNDNCSIKYILKGDSIDFDKFIFPNYFIYISKQQNQISIFMESRNEKFERDSSLDFPSELFNQSAFDDNYIAKIKLEVTDRIDKIYAPSTIVNNSKLFRDNDFYWLEYTHFFG